MSTVSWDSVDVCLTVSAATHTNSWHVLGLIKRSLIILHAVYVDVLLKMQDWRTQEPKSFRKLRTRCWNLLWVHSWVTSHNSISSKSSRGSLGSRSLCSLVRSHFQPFKFGAFNIKFHQNCQISVKCISEAIHVTFMKYVRVHTKVEGRAVCLLSG